MLFQVIKHLTATETCQFKTVNMLCRYKSVISRHKTSYIDRNVLFQGIQRLTLVERCHLKAINMLCRYKSAISRHKTTEQ